MSSGSRIGRVSAARLCVLFSFAIMASLSSAQWVLDGAGVCTADDYQWAVEMCSDGAGGAIVVWEDWRGTDIDIYAQRIDPYGNPLWAADGVPVIIEEGQQMRPRICADGFGGAIITWESDRFDDWNLRGQRLDPDGNMYWNDFGARIGAPAVASDQVNARLVSDGVGGAYVAWEDDRNGNPDIYAQHVRNINGQWLWMMDGIRVCDYAGDQGDPNVVSDGADGVIVAWRDERGPAPGIYAQRYANSAARSWDLDGNALAIVEAGKGAPQLVSDGASGAIVVWHDRRVSSTYFLFAQRVDADGVSLWGPSGTRVSVNTAEQMFPDIAPDGAGGAYVVWRDYRGADHDIYGQRLNANGVIQWAGGGNIVSAVTGWQSFAQVCLASDGEAVFAWKDGRYNQYDIFAQKLDAAGSPRWLTNGVPLCTEATEDQSKPVMVSDADGGALVAWDDYRHGFYCDVYAQRVDQYGYWGYPAAKITGVDDVPDDQGGWVDVAWDASRLDDGWGPVQEYTVWGEELGTLNWQLLTTVAADGAASYAAMVPTVADSGSDGLGLHEFRVTTQTNHPSVAWESPMVIGYSVDNIAPSAPQDMGGQVDWEQSSLTLTWPAVTAPDFSHYAVYADWETGLPGPSGDKNFGELIGTTRETYFVLTYWSPSHADVYRVSAVDQNGNESLTAAFLLVNDISDVNDEIPTHTFLVQNTPNPFNPKTEIRYGLRRPGPVSLRVYDVNGRLVRQLVHGVRAAGEHRLVWDGCDGAGRSLGSGLYFGRLVADGRVLTMKMVLAR